VGGSLHDGLRTLKLQLGADAFAQGEVSVAREEKAQLRNPELLVELGEAATGNVEFKAGTILVEDIDFQRVGFVEARQQGGDFLHGRTTELFPDGLTVAARDLFDHPANEGVRTFSAELRLEGFDDRGEDPSFDLSLLQQGEVLHGFVSVSRS